MIGVAEGHYEACLVAHERGVITDDELRNVLGFDPKPAEARSTVHVRIAGDAFDLERAIDKQMRRWRRSL